MDRNSISIPPYANVHHFAAFRNANLCLFPSVGGLEPPVHDFKPPKASVRVADYEQRKIVLLREFDRAIVSEIGRTSKSAADMVVNFRLSR